MRLYLPCRFAEFLVHLAESKPTSGAFSLVGCLVAYFQATEGPGNRKAFLPSRLVKKKKAKASEVLDLFYFVHCRCDPHGNLILNIAVDAAA